MMRKVSPLIQPSALAWSSSRYCSKTSAANKSVLWHIADVVITRTAGLIKWMKSSFGVISSRSFHSPTPQHSTPQKPTSLCFSVWRWRMKKWLRQPSKFSETQDKKLRRSYNRYDRKDIFLTLYKWQSISLFGFLDESRTSLSTWIYTAFVMFVFVFASERWFLSCIRKPSVELLIKPNRLFTVSMQSLTTRRCSWHRYLKWVINLMSTQPHRSVAAASFVLHYIIIFSSCSSPPASVT